MFYVYIIYSEMKDSYYIGYTSNLQGRLKKHNTGATRSTKKTNDWKVVYKEKINSKKDALKREREIKSWKSRKMIEKLIQAH